MRVTRSIGSRMRPYRKRDRRLRKLGLANSYQEYLKSDLWADIRKRVLERDDHKCRCCGGHATQAHHSAYTSAALLGHSINALFAICGRCHKFIEFDIDGNKCGTFEARKQMRMLCAMNKQPAPKNGPKQKRKTCVRCKKSRTFKRFSGNRRICKKCENKAGNN